MPETAKDIHLGSRLKYIERGRLGRNQAMRMRRQKEGKMRRKSKWSSGVNMYMEVERAYRALFLEVRMT